MFVPLTPLEFRQRAVMYYGDKTGIVDEWFHTSDMAIIDEEGYFTIVDRKKDIIVPGGENISSVEVEKVIQDHPSVFEVVVIGIPKDKWGEVPKALVVLKPDKKNTEEDINSHVKAKLANYKAPKTVEFRDAFPKGGTGKVLKRELREEYLKGFTKKVH
jgi:fatty-acyl-CoA synthase